MVVEITTPLTADYMGLTNAEAAFTSRYHSTSELMGEDSGFSCHDCREV